MTPVDVHDRLATIAALTDDPEAAHIAEDRLHGDVLRAIATGTATDPEWMAALALDTSELNFPRWYA